MSYLKDRILKSMEKLNNYSEIEVIITDFFIEFEKLSENRIKEKGPKDMIPFGKYKGKTISEVSAFDKPYLQWVLRQAWFEKFEDLKILVIKAVQ